MRARPLTLRCGDVGSLENHSFGFIRWPCNAYLIALLVLEGKHANARNDEF